LIRIGGVSAGDELVGSDHLETHRVLSVASDQTGNAVLDHVHPVVAGDVEPVVGRIRPEAMDVAEGLKRGLSGAGGRSAGAEKCDGH
jgi:hypothetical protein